MESGDEGSFIYTIDMAFQLQLLANERTECECESERQVWGVVQRYFVILFVRTTEQLLK